MIAVPFALVAPAKEAGMKVPDNIDGFDPSEYPHFQVFLHAQLGAAMPSPNSHWENAKIIAAIPMDRIRVITTEELTALGFQEGTSRP